MNIKSNIFIVLILSCFLLLKVSGTNVIDYRNEFEKARMARHVEIRRELEREATPFLEMTKINFPFAAFSINIRTKAGVNDIKTTWQDFFSTFTLLDYITGIFSVVSLSFGTIYVIYRSNPFADKVEK